MRRASCYPWASTSACFNPHPAMRPSATRRSVVPIGVDIEFQSSPGHEAECDVFGGVKFNWLEVFQSSPGHEAECDGGSAFHPPSSPGFNPHPAMRPSATASLSLPSSPTRQGFNPHPAMRPSATGLASGETFTLPTFQSSPGHEAECDLLLRAAWPHAPSFNPHPAMRPSATAKGVGRSLRHRVSILTRP